MSEVKRAVTAVDKAANALLKANNDIKKTMASLDGLVSVSNNMAFEIEQLASEMALMDDEFKKRKREADADLAIAIKENESQVLKKLMAARNLSELTKAEHAALEHRAAIAEENLEKAVEEAVAAKGSQMHAANQSVVQSIEAKHKVATAQLEAQVKGLADKITYLEQSNSTLQSMLEAERVARVEMAKNTSQPVVNVNGGKG